MREDTEKEWKLENGKLIFNWNSMYVSVRIGVSIRGYFFCLVEEAGDFHAVFVAAAGEVDDEDVVFGHGGGEFEGVGDGVGGFEGGDDAFALGE